MNSFDLTKFRNQLLAENASVEETKITNADKVGSDGVATEDAMEESLNLDPSSPQISQYWDIMVKNQPEDVIKMLTDLTAGRLSFQEFQSSTEDDIYDSFRDDDMDLDEGTLEEMASFYKLTDNSPEAKAAIIAAKEKFKPGTTLYNTLDTLEKTGEIDYKELAKSTGKDMATFNNPKSREVLEKELATFVQAGTSPAAVKTSRPADQNKVAAAPKEKSPKLKITNPKPKSTSTKLADLAPSDAFSSAGPDEEEMEMEKQAMKAAKGNKRLGTTVEKLAQVTKEMKALAKEYQAAKGTPAEAGIVAQLKGLTAEKKALEKKTASKQMSAADLMGGEDL